MNSEVIINIATGVNNADFKAAIFDLDALEIMLRYKVSIDKDIRTLCTFAKILRTGDAISAGIFDATHKASNNVCETLRKAGGSDPYELGEDINNLLLRITGFELISKIRAQYRYADKIASTHV